MAAPDLLHALQDRGLKLWAEGDRLLVAPKERITDEARALIREHKPELLVALTSEAPPDPAAEARRQKVFAMLAERPEIGRAYVVEDSGQDTVIIAWAIRGVCSSELSVPREKWDPFLFLELFERHFATVH